MAKSEQKKVPSNSGRTPGTPHGVYSELDSLRQKVYNNDQLIRELREIKDEESSMKLPPKLRGRRIG